MSKKKEIELDDFFLVKSENLKVDEPLGFDCFIHLEENQKLIHWMRQGAKFTADRKEKLARIGNPPLMVMTSQRLAYLAYIGARESATKPLSVPVFGKVHQRDDTGMMMIKGTPASSSAASAKAGAAQTSSTQSTSPKLRVDADFLNAVVKSTIEVFQDRFETPLNFQPPKPRKADSANPVKVDIASFIALTSETIRGTIGLCFPAETYRYLLCKATGYEYPELSHEMCIGCGEFISFIYESALPKLLNLGYLIDVAVPTLIVGKELSLHHLIPDKGFSIIFESPGGQFSFEIGIKTGT